MFSSLSHIAVFSVNYPKIYPEPESCLEKEEPTRNPKKCWSAKIHDLEKGLNKKICRYCWGSGHAIDKCQFLDEIFAELENFCFENRMNLELVRDYLLDIDSNIIKLYIQRHNLVGHLAFNYSEYYNTNIMGLPLHRDRMIEMIIAYLCVIPDNPWLRSKRTGGRLQNYIV